jgi:hypothetical protein
MPSAEKSFRWPDPQDQNVAEPPSSIARNFGFVLLKFARNSSRIFSFRPIQSELENTERVAGGGSDAAIWVIHKASEFRLVLRISNVAQNREDKGQMLSFGQRFIEERLRLLPRLHKKHSCQRLQILVTRAESLKQLPASGKRAGSAPERVAAEKTCRAAEMH